MQERSRKKNARFLDPKHDLQNWNCSTDTHMTGSRETNPEDIEPIALGYDVWKADVWAESGMASKILLTRKVSPSMILEFSIMCIYNIYICSLALCLICSNHIHTKRSRQLAFPILMSAV